MIYVFTDTFAFLHEKNWKFSDYYHITMQIEDREKDSVAMSLKTAEDVAVGCSGDEVGQGMGGAESAAGGG